MLLVPLPSLQVPATEGAINEIVLSGCERRVELPDERRGDTRSGNCAVVYGQCPLNFELYRSFFPIRL